MDIIDISDPSAPSELGRRAVSADLHTAVVSEDVAYLADGGSVQAIDVSGPINPVGIAMDSSDNIYVADAGNYRVQIFKIEILEI